MPPHRWLWIRAAKVSLCCYKPPHWLLIGQGSGSFPTVCDTDWLQSAGNKYAHLWKSKVKRVKWNLTSYPAFLLAYVLLSLKHHYHPVCVAFISTGEASALNRLRKIGQGESPSFSLTTSSPCSNTSLPYRLPGISPFLHQSFTGSPSSFAPSLQSRLGSFFIFPPALPWCSLTPLLPLLAFSQSFRHVFAQFTYPSHFLNLIPFLTVCF